MKNLILTITATALMGVCFACGQTAPAKPEPIRVGSYEVYVLQDYLGSGETDILIDAPAEVLAAYAPDGTFPMATNAVLIRRGERVWLIDTAYGDTIFDKMAALGIETSDVNEVLFTHMHGDHIGGMLREGAKAFPNATVSLSQREAEYWKGVGDQAASDVFSACGDAIHLCSPVQIDAPMSDGITPVAAYGHTPGHTMYLVKEGDEQLLIWGDLTHAMAVQMPHPEISVHYDVDPVQARETRLAVLRHLAATGIPILGLHIASTTEGTIVATGGGYELRSR